VKHVSAETVAAARAEAESARQEVTALRKAKSRRWAWRLSLLALLVIAAGFAVSRFPRRIPSEVQLLSPRLSELDSTLQSLEDNNLKEARRESDASVRLVSYVLQLRWHTPKHFAAKTFGVRIESLKYDIVGFAARFENKHGQQAPIDPCSVAPKSLSFELPSDSSPTYVFIRLKAPKDYSFPDILKLLTAHPGRAGSVCSGN
jgi:hypothetical protein